MVDIKIPHENSNESGKIRIEGPKEGVLKAQEMLKVTESAMKGFLRFLQLSSVILCRRTRSLSPCSTNVLLYAAKARSVNEEERTREKIHLLRSGVTVVWTEFQHDRQ